MRKTIKGCTKLKLNKFKTNDTWHLVKNSGLNSRKYLLMNGTAFPRFFNTLKTSPGTPKFSEISF